MNYKTKINYNRPSYKLKASELNQGIKCNMYGPSIKNMNFFMDLKTFEKIERTEGEKLKNCEFVIEIKNQEYKAIIKEIQVTHIGYKTSHIDFYVYSDKTFNCKVPVVVINKDQHTKMKKSTFIYNIQSFDFKVTNQNIPYIISVDYTMLKNDERVFFDGELEENNQHINNQLLCCVSK